MTDIKAHVEVSSNYPPSPSLIHISRAGSRRPKTYRADKDGSLLPGDGNHEGCGRWWPHSATCVELELHGVKTFYQFIEGTEWLSADGKHSLTWTRKRNRDSIVVPKPIKTLSAIRRRYAGDSSTNVSRFRMTVLPIDPLDARHKDQLSCMGLRICHHLDVGRVLVTSRSFQDGEAVIYSRVKCFDVESDPQVLDIVDPSHPSCCYLLVPRIKKLYYNKDAFSADDPIASGDLWYLVNHSNRPNVEVILRKEGIQFKAKRAIQANEPLVWTYPPCFFGKDEGSIDLPQNVLADEAVSIRE